MNKPQRLLVAIFTNRARAERAIRALRNAGFSDQDIGMAARPIHANDFAAGLAGLPAVTTELPEMGPVTGAGILAANWKSAALQGVARTLPAVGVPDDEAWFCQEHLARGDAVAVVNAKDRYSEALAILSAHGSTEVVRQFVK